MVLFGRNWSPRSRCSPRRHRATASTSRSRRRGSRSSTGRPSTCSRTPTSANGAEPWLIPDIDGLPSIDAGSRPGRPRTGTSSRTRDAETLARPRAIPGTPGLEHRIGGLEKADGTGNVLHDPDNHDLMTGWRAEGGRIAADIPELEVDDLDGAEPSSWAGVGRRRSPPRRARRERRRPRRARAPPLPEPAAAEHGRGLSRYDRVLIPEMNLGQLLKLVRAEFLVDAVGYNRVRGVRSGRASWWRRSRRCCGSDDGQRQRRQRARADPAQGEGLQVRPGGPLVPGSGDYAVLAAVQGFMPEPRPAARADRVRQRHRLRGAVPVLHGDVRDALDSRPAPAIATGLAVSRPVKTCPCGSSRETATRSHRRDHLIHALRRNIGIKILMFNNEVYGLTKGQYSPTSPRGQLSGSTPYGSIDAPFNPLSSPSAPTRPSSHGQSTPTGSI